MGELCGVFFNIFDKIDRGITALYSRISCIGRFSADVGISKNRIFISFMVLYLWVLSFHDYNDYNFTQSGDLSKEVVYHNIQKRDWPHEEEFSSIFKHADAMWKGNAQ